MMTQTQQMQLLLALVRRAGIWLDERTDTDLVGTRLETGGYHIVLGRMWAKADEAGKLALLRHELGHIVRGDCLPETKRIRPKHSLANIAEDACINTPEMVKAVERSTGITGSALYERLQPQLDGLPAHYIPSAQTIYKALEAKVASMPPLKCSFCSGANHSDGLTDEQAAVAHAQTIIKIRPQDAAEEEALGKGADLGQIAAPDRSLARLQCEMPAALISAAIEAIEGARHQGERRPRRTWAREGRHPGLKGIARMPHALLMLAIDVSGSMSSWYGYMAALADRLASRHRLQVCTFDTSVRRHGQRLPSSVQWGGGTNFRPVMALAEQVRPDALIMVTDGQAGDKYQPPAGVPVIWVTVDEGERLVELRGRDRMVPWRGR